ncbi:MAG: gliding motility-associated C-terminal domain-containing protein [Chitinophagaceae bacterium]
MNKNCLGKFHYWLLLMCTMLSFAHVNAQGYNTTNWRYSNPKQFGFTVFDVDYFDNNNVIAVGSDGGIAKSTDGGTNWTYGVFTFIDPKGFTVRSTFNDVHYVTANIAYAVGASGSMAKTIDGGATWTFVNTPLFANSKSINACWFLDANKGYIGGDVNNAADSLPRLYVTLNGGSTWDSIAPPAVNGVSRVGYISNSFIPSVLFPVDAKLKSIYSIQFINDSTGYVCGSNSYGVNIFPNVSLRATSTTVCNPLTTLLTSGSMGASLLWKIKSGVLTDYSLSKERLGYTGINVNTPYNCTSAYASITPVSQTYRAMNIINDSTVVVMSFNNNTVVKVKTGRNDSTANVNATGVFEKGKYEVLNFPFPPTAGPNAGPSIPSTQVLVASNPYHMVRTSNGTLVVGSSNTNFNPGYLWTSVDTGRNWVQNSVYPQNQNWSPFVGALAIDIAPNGKILALGNNGVVGDSSVGGIWKSNYVAVPLSGSYNDIEFADCNNGIAAGGGTIAVTVDGGKNWIDKTNAALSGLFANITSVTYPQVNKAYFTTNIGTIYRSNNQGTNLLPVFIDNYGGTSLINDLAAVGTSATADSLWACGVQQSSSSVSSAQRSGLVYRSFNNGASWDTIKVGPMGTTGTQAQQYVTFKGIEFPSRNIGYICGNRGAIYKTTDAGATWTNISPFPTLNIGPAGYTNSAMSYTDIQALDNNTVFVVGSFFTANNNRRIYKTTDGGATWLDISANIDLLTSGNLSSILMHDANNGYATAGNGLYITNDGGTTWTLDLPPTGTTAYMAFAPKTVPASISMINRKMFTCGVSVSGSPILEYGKLSNITVGSSEVITTPTCSNLTAGSITVNATGGIRPYTYSLNSGAFQASNVFTGLPKGNDTITIKDAYCGTFTKIVTLGFTDNLTLTTTPTIDTTVCAGAPVPLLAISPANTVFAWTPAAGLSSTSISNPIATVNSNSTFTVTATLNGCIKTKTIPINIKANPVVNAGPDKTILIGDQTVLDGSGNNNVSSIAWTPAATLSGANTFTPVAKPTQTTTYTLTVKDANNCTSADDALVTVIPYCVDPKDAFTPNGDGINDKWVITAGTSCLSANGLSVKVYNRYGGLVYSNDNYQNNWDGTYNGKAAADGTYYYQIVYRLFNGTSVNAKGNVTILR